VGWQHNKQNIEPINQRKYVIAETSSLRIVVRRFKGKAPGTMYSIVRDIIHLAAVSGNDARKPGLTR
jgi:hypothetical protein